jgi:hypothetical protein
MIRFTTSGHETHPRVALTGDADNDFLVLMPNFLSFVRSACHKEDLKKLRTVAKAPPIDNWWRERETV